MTRTRFTRLWRADRTPDVYRDSIYPAGTSLRRPLRLCLSSRNLNKSNSDSPQHSVERLDQIGIKIRDDPAPLIKGAVRRKIVHERKRVPIWFSLIIGFVLIVFLPAISNTDYSSVSNITPPRIDCYFSPNGNCTKTIISEIKSAKETILVQAYSFTSEPIALALIDAYRRGVKIEIVLDKSQRTERYSEADAVSRSGIPTFIDSKHAIAHNKIMILDRKVLITGSFNFTASAEDRNAENLLIIKDQTELVRKYTDNYLRHKEHSEKY